MFKIERYVLIKNNIIVASYCTSQGLVGIAKSIYNQNIGWDDIKRVPENSEYEPTKNIKEYENHKLKPVSVRVKEGLFIVPENHILDGEVIRPMNIEERVNAGTYELDPLFKAIKDQIISKTEEELIAEGIKTKEQIEDEKLVAEEEKLIAEEIRKMAIENLGNKLIKVKE